ncbi:MAG TPA: hypothetical protein VGV87_17780 [Blastocatellia bacterium]|jgi:hypothetical protein|nr:hypothetical protein [Blastocatellia bacterium]
MADELPPEVTKLHDALRRLAGVHDTSSGIECVDGVTAEHLRLACFAQLPHGAMRRTDGAVPNEVQVQVEFRVEPSPEGWRSLEFLAWWIRDSARGGLPIQLRPFALPPTLGSNVQLEHTLRFHIDYFFTHPSREIEPVLAAVSELADDLNQTIEIYELSLRNRGGPSLFSK